MRIARSQLDVRDDRVLRSARIQFAAERPGQLFVGLRLVRERLAVLNCEIDDLRECRVTKQQDADQNDSARTKPGMADILPVYLF